LNAGKRNKCVLAALIAVVLNGAAFAQPFVHPGCLSTSNDLARIKARVEANAQPWKGSWDRLAANSHAQLGYSPRPQAQICRGGSCASENYILMANDAAAAYQCALRSHGSGNTNYANKSIQIMDVWANTLTNITGSTDALLALGAQGYQWACAAELMRDYPPWISSGGFTNFQAWLLREFYSECRRFLLGTTNGGADHNGTCDTHYWANWDLFAMNAVIAIGVVCDRRDIYKEAINYYLAGVGNGAAARVVWQTHPGYLGQWQESGRDQGHNVLGPILLGSFCEIAWNQGDDMYGYATNLFLAGSEYVAKYNVSPLTNSVPYVTYVNCEYDVQTGVSSFARGGGRPGWDLIYNHYVHRTGLSAPYTELMAAQVRPEGGGGNYGSTSGGYDQLGFTTLTHTLDPIATNSVPAPGNLRADVRNNSVVLSWWGSAYASSYRVKRATAIGGPYITIATDLPSNKLSCQDIGLAHGTTYYYVVSAMIGEIETTNSTPIVVTPNRRLSGTILGSSGSWNNEGLTKEHVFDDSLGTFFDAATGNGQWAGLDLGVSNVISQVKYCPRAGFGGRMVGGQFQGANVPDFSSAVVTLFTISSSPPNNTLTTQTFSSPGAFRYVRYLSPNGGSCNVAEVQFFGAPAVPTPPPAPLNVQASAGNWEVSLTWTVPDTTISFNLKRATISGGPYSMIATGLTTTGYLDIELSNSVTYFYVVSAVNAAGEGSSSAEVSATTGLPIPVTFNPRGAVWRYFDKTNDLGEAWRSNSFTDSTWSSGAARLGYGGDGEATKIASNRQWTTYFRREFHVPNATNVTALNARLTRDDAVIIYLNGTEIWRDTNFTSGDITNRTPALVAIGGQDETEWFPLALPSSHLSLLLPGTNLLAAEVHNQSLSSSDLGFDFELTGAVAIAVKPAMRIANSLGNVTLFAPAESSYFTVCSAPHLNPPMTWTPLTNRPVLTNNEWRVTFPAATNGQRFFRLQSQ
jgi:hypothetical protein